MENLVTVINVQMINYKHAHASQRQGDSHLHPAPRHSGAGIAQPIGNQLPQTGREGPSGIRNLKEWLINNHNTGATCMGTTRPQIKNTSFWLGATLKVHQEAASSRNEVPQP